MRRRNLLQNKYKHIRYSNDGGTTFTVASKSAIDEVNGSLPLEGRNLLDVSKIVESVNASSLTITNASTNSFSMVGGTKYNNSRIQNVLPFVTDTAKWRSRKYVLSGYIKASVNTMLKFDFSDVIQNEEAINATSTSTYFTVTFSSTNYLTSPYYGFIDVNLPTAPTANITFSFDRLKLEVGDKASAWSPTNLVDIENAEKNTWIGRNLITNDLAQVYELVVPTNNTAFNTNRIPMYYGQKICYSFYVKSTSVSSLAKTIIVQFYDALATNRISCYFVTVPVSTEYTRIEGSIINNIQNAKYIAIGYRSTTDDTLRVLTYKNAKIEYGDTATPWTPAPEDCTFGTTEGEYMGTLVWDKPYPSNDPNDYTWRTNS